MYEENTFGLYANSSQEYWAQIDRRSNFYYKLSDLVHFIDTWNETSLTWNRISDNEMKNASHLFRLLL